MDHNDASQFRGLLDVILIHFENDGGVLYGDVYFDYDSKRTTSYESRHFGLHFAIRKRFIDWNRQTDSTSVNEKGMRLFWSAATQLGASKYNAIECIDAWLRKSKPRRKKGGRDRTAPLN